MLGQVSSCVLWILERRRPWRKSRAIDVLSFLLGVPSANLSSKLGCKLEILVHAVVAMLTIVSKKKQRMSMVGENNSPGSQATGTMI